MAPLLLGVPIKEGSPIIREPLIICGPYNIGSHINIGPSNIGSSYNIGPHIIGFSYYCEAHY